MAPNSATGSLLRDELLNGEIFSTFKEAQIVIEAWLARCNKLPHQRLLQRPGPWGDRAAGRVQLFIAAKERLVTARPT